LEGNPIPVKKGLVLDFSGMNRILNIREEDFQADVEPGVIYQDLNNQLRHKGLFFPPDPGAQATLGGMIANNASGTRTVRYGSTRNYVLKLTIALANGDIIETGSRAAKTSSGYDLINLFVGSEGTLGIVIEATVRLTGFPEVLAAMIITLPTLEAASESVFEMVLSGLDPAALELLSPECIELINQEKNLGLSVAPTLFIELHGSTKTQLSEAMEIAKEICDSHGAIQVRSGLGREQRDRLFEARYELAEMIRRKHPGRSHLVVDAAVPISAYPDMIRFAGSEAAKIDVPGYVFGHAGDGNIHLAFEGKTGDNTEWELIDTVSQRVVFRALELGGTCTGEHGVGIGKRQFMEAEHGQSLEWMKRIKNLFDPNGILNPGKIF
jgi:D-lactate dehydrogenase (cytochrome)